jgi:hypothetical protein
MHLVETTKIGDNEYNYVLSVDSTDTLSKDKSLYYNVPMETNFPIPIINERLYVFVLFLPIWNRNQNKNICLHTCMNKHVFIMTCYTYHDGFNNYICINYCWLQIVLFSTNIEYSIWNEKNK